MNRTIIIGAIIFGIGAVSATTGSIISGERLLPIATIEDYEAATPYSEDGTLIQEIALDLDNRSIEIYATDDDTVKLDYYVSSYDRIALSLQAGVLSVVSSSDPYIFFGGIGFFLNQAEVFKVSLGVPASSSLELIGGSSNGRIDISGLQSIEKIGLTTSNGDITINEVDTIEWLDLETSNGQIVMADITVTNEINVDSSNGRLHFFSVTCPYIDGETSNGRIWTERLSVSNLQLETSNGEISANVIGFLADYRVNMSTSNGRYFLDGERVSTNSYNTLISHISNSIRLMPSTGDVKLSFNPS